MKGSGLGRRLLASRGGSRPGPPWGAALPAPRRGFVATAPVKSYDMRRVEITPLEQRKLTFDTHALVQELEVHGFVKEQAETIVSALTTLSNLSLDTVYKDMVTQAQQVEITLQQIMAHLDSIRNMVILEKSEFANLRAENEMPYHGKRGARSAHRCCYERCKHHILSWNMCRTGLRNASTRTIVMRTWTQMFLKAQAVAIGTSWRQWGWLI
ncbi:coiled-coil domain-containing protein 90B, mitochondrial, partial [Dermochelys coriacea]|uniref:coiled-coil domain-containing protein 90B, mitochondrial n=1 Tax=Dermochelys coriacea TaxID=27794 RepID=UPI0018E8BD51